MRKPKVGEVLYCVPKYDKWDNPHNVTVTKIGRKYFYTDEWKRYRIKDWIEDKGEFVYESQLWESKEIYEQMRVATDYKLGLPSLMPKLNIEQTIKVYNFVKGLLDEEHN